MKNDLPHFQHDNDARNHPKMKALIGRFGPAGYGRFWMLNELIAAAPEARLDLSKKINLLAVAAELRLELTEFSEFLAFLSDPEIDLVNENQGVYTTDRTTEDYLLVKSGRESAKDRKTAKKPSSPEKSESSPELPQGSPEKSKRAEQSRRENSIPMQAVSDKIPEASENPFDKEPTPEELFGETPACLPVGKDHVQEVKEIFGKYPGLSFDEKTIEPIAEYFTDLEYLEYVIKRCVSEKPRKLSGFFLTQYRKTEWREEWEAKKIRDFTPKKAAPPGNCKCGGQIRYMPTEGEGRCLTCGTWWKYDYKAKAWRKGE